MSIFRNKKIIVVLALALLTIVFWYGNKKPEAGEERYRTRVIDRGDIVQTISANGTLTPVVLVNVGTQISGTVSKLHVDYNDPVKIGQVLAELDPALLKAQLKQSEANLSSAQTALKIAHSKLERNRLLKEKEFISSEALEIIEQELETARAQFKVSKAQVTRDRANLDYSIIKSPISGVIIARDIDIGQTVAANFQTPILFQIARDLRQMQINISVAEADIGQLHLDQQINFTVDAFLDRTFAGAVKQVRLNPTIQENVVTYNVVAMVSNDDRTLLPGMTANIRFVVKQKQDVLRVPNAALRFRPSSIDSATPLIPSGSVVYQLKNGKPAPINVTIGITDGHFTEIIEGQVNVGESLILREISDKKESQSNLRFRMF
ncbi:MAG: efflux RND transporter periplasmic adaptor subunit [Nitrosomonas sp.]|nr:efflux RND transporter periplasmic adaptor subunit [Nitrosomonas sp.]MDP1951762.1 efflux RND transporter periplasmic adaptor subunit [Nitrosomonas sp.]